MQTLEHSTATRRALVNPPMATLTLSEVRKSAPAVFGRVARHMTERYQQVKTGQVLEALMERGYQVTMAKQERARSRDPLTVRHMVTLVHEKALARRNFKEGVPTLLLVNSHNGRSVLKFSTGFYRFICANGLIVGTTEQEFIFRHAAKPLAGLDAALESLTERSRVALEHMESWSDIILPERKVHAFAEKAAQLRFGEDAARAYDLEMILTPRRPEDASNDLWHVMNRVQENLMRGGVTGKSANGRKVTSKVVNNITLDLAFNRGLWSLTEEFAAKA
jgi:hypothetical protein